MLSDIRVSASQVSAYIHVIVVNGYVSNTPDGSQ